MNRHCPVGWRPSRQARGPESVKGLRSPPRTHRNECGGERSHRPTGAFSLIEVIVALGILGGGLTAVIAMFAPLARVERETEEKFAAVAAANAVNGYLRLISFDEVRSAMEEDFFVSRSGERVGRAGSPEWLGHEHEKFFSVVALPNKSLPDDAATLPWLAFSLRVRWPASATEGVGQREVVFPGSVHR